MVDLVPYIVAGRNAGIAAVLAAEAPSIAHFVTGTLSDVTNEKLPFTRPPIQALIDAWIRGTITDTGLSDPLLMAGIPLLKDDSVIEGEASASRQLQAKRLWQAVVDANITIPNPGELIIALQRNIIGPKFFDAVLKRHGMTKHWVRDLYAQLAKAIPGPSDLVHFVLRHGFEPSVIEALNLGAEFPKSAREWFGKQGLNYVFNVTDPFTNQESATSWADMYWQTHWVYPSPTQGYQFFQRLREDTIGRIRQSIPDASVFTLADLNRLLRINDYPPAFRANLAAIAYLPITTTDVRALFRAHLIEDDEFISRIRDTGHSEADSRTLLQLENVTRARMRASSGRGWTPSALAEGFAVGLVPADLVSREMARQGYNDEEIQSLLDRARIDYQSSLVRRGNTRLLTTATTTGLTAYRTGSISRNDIAAILDGLGWRQQTINAVLEAEDLAAANDAAKQVLRHTKTSFLRGLINADQARTTISTVIVIPARVEEYIAEWVSEFTPRRKLFATGQVVKLYEQGLMDFRSAEQALLNLGWTDPDALLVLSSANLAIRQTEIKQLAAAEKAASKEAKALESLERKQVAQLNKTHAGIRRATPPSKLKTWLANDQINESYFVGRLEAMGIDPEVIDEYLAEARSARDVRRAKRVGAPRPDQAPRIKEESIATLQRWFIDDIVNEEQFREQAAEIGFKPDDVEQYLLEAMVSKEMRSAKKTSAISSVASSTGNGTRSGTTPTTSG